jgi:hypothetical protein
VLSRPNDAILPGPVFVVVDLNFRMINFSDGKNEEGGRWAGVILAKCFTTLIKCSNRVKLLQSLKSDMLQIDTLFPHKQ